MTSAPDPTTAPDGAPSVRRIHPEPGATTIAEAYDIERRRRGDRPWIGLCMVTSLDGTVAVDGSSGALGNPNDVEVLRTLRSLADLLLVGAGTIRREGYGPPKKPGQRIGVVSNSGRLDLDTELFTSGAGFLIVPDAADVDDSRVDVLRAGREEVDIAVAVTRLEEVVADLVYVQAEGGPSLNASLMAADVLDELDVTIAARLAGGDGPRLTNGAPEIDRRYELDQLLVDDDGFLFGRWLRRR